MAKINSKSPTNKKIDNKIEGKKKHYNKVNSTKKTNLPSKANIKRGKLPSNWNSYVETQSSTGTNKNGIKKFPKNLSAIIKSDHVKIESKVIDMGRSKVPKTNRCIAMDCEMVGINDAGRDHMLARVSIVDEHGSVVYDTFVKPTQQVVDYRTTVSGVRPNDIVDGRDFSTVQTEVHKILQDKVLIGHAVHNDLKVLYLHHNKKYIRDTSKFKTFRKESNGMTPSLKLLSSRLLDMEIQTGEHSSIEDARACMQLYMKFRNLWEAELHKNKKIN